jgi:hypothetical protein
MYQPISPFDTPGLTDETLGLPISTHVVDIQRKAKGMLANLDTVVSRISSGGTNPELDQLHRAMARTMDSGFAQMRSAAVAMPPIEMLRSFEDYWEDSNKSYRRDIEQTLLPTKASIETLFPKGIESVVGKKRKRRVVGGGGGEDEY